MAARPDGPLLVIVGPTASGKTALAIELAKRFNGEIICADSRTLYKYMDIGTAKPTLPELQAVPHHLLSIIEPDQPFTVVDFKRQAEVAISDILGRGKLPILVGGSGLYIDSVAYDYQFSQDDTRDVHNARHAAAGSSGTRSKLRSLTLLIGMDIDQDTLVKRIALRIDDMFERGLVAETEILAEKYGWEIDAMKTYAPLREYMNGRQSIGQAKEKMIIKDRQLAKKQRTWFKRNNSIHWCSDLSKIVDLTTTFLNTAPATTTEQKS